MTVREATQKYLEEHGYPDEINDEEAFQQIMAMATPMDPVEAQLRCARQALSHTLNTNGYYKSIGDSFVNTKCDDMAKLAYVANRAGTISHSAKCRSKIFQPRTDER